MPDFLSGSPAGVKVRWQPKFENEIVFLYTSSDDPLLHPSNNSLLGCARKGYPGVYARVSAVIDWIDDSICRNSCFPPTSCSDPTVHHPCAAHITTGDDTASSIASGPVSLKISVVTDNYPNEVGLIFSNSNTGKEHWFVGYDSDPVVKGVNGLKVFEKSFTKLSSGFYNLELFDKSRDGLW